MTMRRFSLHAIVLSVVLTLASLARATAGEFSFGVIPHLGSNTSANTALRDVIEETDTENLAFVVANGIKSTGEPCTDKLYEHRKILLDGAKNGLIVSLAASDWAMCTNENGKSNAILKLSQLRELFFADDFSIGATKIPLTRQSTAAKFRTVAENARWEIGNVMFATINLPANNNHYVYDAGRNSEFEDRQVANRAWLNRIFTFAARKNARGIVLFSDANPLSKPSATERRDGYAEVRKQLITLATKYSGKVLLVHGQSGKASNAAAINWHGNLGQLDIGPGWTKVTVTPALPALFSAMRKPASPAHTDSTHSHQRE